MSSNRAENALDDVVAVETIAPGLVRVVTWSDAYPVDARDAGCNCPDKQYHDAPVCKHEFAAMLADSERYPTPFVTGNLHTRAVADGGKRPEECTCDEFLSNDLPCWPCYRDGFETPADTEDNE